MSMLADQVDIVIGVDTHKHTHTGAVIVAATGAAIDGVTVPTDSTGYAELVSMADRHSTRRAWSIEGTGSYGAGLTRHLVLLGERVVELDRPGRPARRNGAKSDSIDAARAGREALAREHLAEPRRDQERAAVSVLLAVRGSAVDGSRVAQQQLHALVTAAPEDLRSRFRGSTTAAMTATASRLRLSPHWDVETRSYATVLRELAQRVLSLRAVAREHERSIVSIVRSWRPDLLEVQGVGPIVAAVVLCAWSHPGRCRHEAAFASLAGVSPIPASSGMTTRHRLNHSGDRQLNRALHVIAISRVRYDAETRAYTERRRAEGKTDREIRRCLKRYIARQLFRQLENPPTTT